LLLFFFTGGRCHFSAVGLPSCFFFCFGKLFVVFARASQSVDAHACQCWLEVGGAPPALPVRITFYFACFIYKGCFVVFSTALLFFSFFSPLIHHHHHFFPVPYVSEDADREPAPSKSSLKRASFFSAACAACFFSLSTLVFPVSCFAWQSSQICADHATRLAAPRRDTTHLLSRGATSLCFRGHLLVLSQLFS
jgi:hypothetical protein